ncbi:universal stress protein, partial [Streptomyces microflavus]
PKFSVRRRRTRSSSCSAHEGWDAWRVSFGSVSLSVIARSTTPVVLVRAEDTSSAREWQTTGDVVVGVDTSQPCDAVLEFAFAHAERHGLALRALHSWRLSPCSSATRQARCSPSRPNWTR